MGCDGQAACWPLARETRGVVMKEDEKRWAVVQREVVGPVAGGVSATAGGQVVDCRTLGRRVRERLLKRMGSPCRREG